MLTVPEFSHGRTAGYRILPELLSNTRVPGRGRWRGKIQTARTILRNVSHLVRILEEQPQGGSSGGGWDRVLMGSYSEYLAPLWAGRLEALAGRRKIVFGAVVHDPVRDYVVGPKAWHRWSVARGYSFLRKAFVHEATVLDTVRPMPELEIVVIPHGPYSFSPPNKTREELRRNWGIPPEAKLFLSFGHLRDNKNLDLILSAMGEAGEAWLLVAGSEAPAGQKPSRFYRGLAEKSGVSSRCRWDIRHIPAEEVGNLFAVADFALLAYSASFRSASGVLNVCAGYGKPVLVSCGEGNLAGMMERYRIGVRIPPDDRNAIAEGMRRMMAGEVAPQWEEYRQDNSWARNARLTVEAMFSP